MKPNVVERWVSIFIREPHWQVAVAMWKISEGRIATLENRIGMDKRTFVPLVNQLNCPTCHQPQHSPCITASGNPASKPHTSRCTLLLAAMLAIKDEHHIEEDPI